MKPLVVGYKGEIGRFILSGLLRTMPKALDIFCVDKNESDKEVKTRIKKSDTIFLCVPMKETIPWLKKYKSLLKKKLVIEQTSLKAWAFNFDLTKEFPDVEFIHMHLLFRPSETPNKEDREVVIVHLRKNQEWYKIIETITESRVSFCDSVLDHDETMAINQALVHRVLIKLGEEIRKTKHRTFISKKIIELSNRIKRGGSLINELQENSFSSEILEKFLTNIKKGSLV